MAELRRILIERERLNFSVSDNSTLKLRYNEIHYLRRVLRMKNCQNFAVIDGIGHLWEASLIKEDLIRLESTIDSPKVNISSPLPLIYLAVVIPRHGFPEILRMCCEIGVDIIQPLFSERSTQKGDSKLIRWKAILRESVEQSERLWAPTLLPIREVSNIWNDSSNNSKFIATARGHELMQFDLALDKFCLNCDQVWVAIGPEGGWSVSEKTSALEAGWINVDLGDNILTTSTASVVAIQTIANWRRLKTIIS